MGCNEFFQTPKSKVCGVISLFRSRSNKRHPFGHARIEYIASFVIAFMILLLGYEFLQNSIRLIINPEQIGFDLVLVIILVASGLVKLWQAGFYKNLGKLIKSEPLIALSKDSRNDVFIAIAVVGSVTFTHFTGIIIDGYVGTLISILILYTGFSVAKDTITKLLGESVSYGDAMKITDMVKSYEGIIDAHDLIVHDYGLTNRMATLHVDMCDTFSFKAVHDIIGRIERNVKKKLNIDLLIRADATPLNDRRFVKIKEKIKQHIQKIDERLAVDDFRIVEHENEVDVFFDLELPYEYDSEKQEEVLRGISKKIKSIDQRYNPIINKERGFIKDKHDTE